MIFLYIYNLALLSWIFNETFFDLISFIVEGMSFWSDWMTTIIVGGES